MTSHFKTTLRLTKAQKRAVDKTLKALGGVPNNSIFILAIMTFVITLTKGVVHGEELLNQMEKEFHRELEHARAYLNQS